MKPIIPWMGGKARLAKDLTPFFPTDPATCYVEMFAGGAAMLFHREPSRAEVINDLNHDLTTLYRVVKHHLDEFMKAFRWSLSSREEFHRQLKQPPETLTDIQRAARFFYLQKLAFGGKVCGQTFGTATTGAPKLNLLRLEEDLSEAHLRLSSVFIENLPWQKCIERYDRTHTFFYADPPYWQTAGYGEPFAFEEYEALAKWANQCQGKMVISINDHPDMRELFKGMPMTSVTIGYTVGGNGTSKRKFNELIIRNFEGVLTKN